MQRLVILVAAACVFTSLVHAGSLPRSLEEIGIEVPVQLDMRAQDLRTVNGDMVRSGRFVTLVTRSPYQLSIKLNVEENRVEEIVVALGKKRFVELVSKLNGLYSKGNQYESEKREGYESHLWSDGNRKLSLIHSQNAYRLVLQAPQHK